VYLFVHYFMYFSNYFSHKVINLGYMDMDVSTLKAANSSVAINECIRKLSSIMHDPTQTVSLFPSLCPRQMQLLQLILYHIAKIVLSPSNLLIYVSCSI
jgi:hypothetical protein